MDSHSRACILLDERGLGVLSSARGWCLLEVVTQARRSNSVIGGGNTIVYLDCCGHQRVQLAIKMKDD